jgi:AraC-like DNA-binding protein
MPLTTMNGTIIPDNLKGIPKFRIYKNTSCEGYPQHWHSGVEVVLPLENSYQVIHGNQVYDLLPNELCFINTGAVHRLVSPPDGGVRIFMQFDLTLLFHLSEIDTMLRLLPPILKMSEETHGASYNQALSYAKEIIREYNSDEAILREATIYSCFIQLYLLVLRSEFGSRKALLSHNASSTHSNEHVRKLLDVCLYVNDHYTQSLSLSEAAYRFGFSKYHFARLFKEFTHSTFHQYLNNLRISHAESLLLNCELSVTEVALMSGFSSISTFNRLFKEQKLISPTEYRKRYANPNSNPFESKFTDTD